ncbi:MAG: 30S ribosomal protein S9 [Bdellovibrionales bacterium]|nr:30S ribosomal protein S9 [Bdellovibrionales bacterium]
MATQYFSATGRKKTSTARVRIRPGKGEIIVNERKFEEYFGRPVLRLVVNQPLESLEMIGKFDIIANCTGGGHAGQAGALRHGISRALLKFNPELRGTLKAGGFLTRDSRQKERKKYGKRGARRGTQFSKR